MPVTEKQMEKLGRLKTSLEAYRAQNESAWEDIIHYLAASYSKVGIDKPGTEGAANYKDIFDTTAIESSNTMADGIQGYAFGRSISWFRLKFEQEDLMKTDTYKRWLESAERHIYGAFNKSNFYDESRAFVKCGSDFGTAVMTVENDLKKGMPVYHTLHPGTYCIEENRHGAVDVLIRDFWLTKEEAIEQFEEGNLPDQMTANKDDVGTLYKFHQYIGPNNRLELDVAGTDEYISLYWADIDPKKECKAERYAHKPFFSWRWAKNPCGSPWGTDAPGMVQIPNIKMLQSLSQDQLRLSQLTGRPPIKKTEGLVVNFFPSGMTDLSPGADFQPVNVTGDLSWIENKITQAQRQIKASYHVDFFLALMNSQDRTKTATEVQGLMDEKSAIMSAFFSRLANEFIEPVLESVFEDEIRYARMPEVPQGLDGNQLGIDFISPLAMLQKRAHELNSTKQYLGEILNIAQIAPSVMDKINIDAYAEIAGDAYNVDHRIIRIDAEVAKIRQARADMQMQQLKQEQQMAQTKAQSQAYTATSKAPEKGSPVEKQMKQQEGE